MTTTIDQALNKFDSWVKTTLEPALEAEWKAIKPQVVALGETVLSQIFQAAVVYVTSGGPANPGASVVAIASVTAQLPADLAASQHIVAAAWAGAVQNLQAKQLAGQAIQ